MDTLLLQKVRIAVGVACLAAGALVTTGVFVPELGSMLRIESASEAEERLVHTETRQVATAGPIMARRTILDISYPKVMRENETSAVRLTYRVESVDVGPRPDNPVASDVDTARQEMEALDADVHIHVGSSGFAIEPRGDLSRATGTPLPITQIWTITPSGEGRRSLLVRVEEKNIIGTRVLAAHGYPGLLDASTTVNGVPTQIQEGGYIELPIDVFTYWGVSRRAASSFVAGASLLGFFLTWPILINTFGNRRRVMCTAHKGRFLDKEVEYVFIKVVNLSPERSVELTHVWFATKPPVPIINNERPLPRKLGPEESWETWIRTDALPRRCRMKCLNQAVVQLSNGQKIRSRPAKRLPPAGHVAGP